MPEIPVTRIDWQHSEIIRESIIRVYKIRVKIANHYVKDVKNKIAMLNRCITCRVSSNRVKATNSLPWANILLLTGKDLTAVVTRVEQLNRVCCGLAIPRYR